MGDYPDKIEDNYCSRCKRVTEHKIYIKQSSVKERETVHGSFCDYDTKNITRNFTTTKRVCSVCGKTKTKTTEDCCKII